MNKSDSFKASAKEVHRLYRIQFREREKAEASLATYVEGAHQIAKFAQHKPECLKHQATICACGHDAAVHTSHRKPLDFCETADGCSCRKFTKDKAAGICTCGLAEAILALGTTNNQTREG